MGEVIRKSIPRVEVIDDQLADALARQSGVQRLQSLYSMHRFARQLIAQRVRVELPKAKESERARKVSRRLLHGSG